MGLLLAVGLLEMVVLDSFVLVDLLWVDSWFGHLHSIIGSGLLGIGDVFVLKGLMVGVSNGCLLWCCYVLYAWYLHLVVRACIGWVRALV